jgi:hypothetical protein
MDTCTQRARRNDSGGRIQIPRDRQRSLLRPEATRRQYEPLMACRRPHIEHIPAFADGDGPRRPRRRGGCRRRRLRECAPGRDDRKKQSRHGCEAVCRVSRLEWAHTKGTMSDVGKRRAREPIYSTARCRLIKAWRSDQIRAREDGERDARGAAETPGGGHV